ncbi:MAG: anaerobic selenocysteine-containing dehydrogenase [Paracrocinitomix sp.]|jgi:anaerobic selenocysteine-containing dehydrogenase
MAVEVKRSFCRICHAACPVDVHIDDSSGSKRVIKVTGVDEDPIFNGYTCIKGRQLPDQIHDPARLRAALRRRPDGTFEEVASNEALDEVAAKLTAIINEHGPRAVATYTGTGGYQNAPSHPVAMAFHKAIDSISYYTSVTIDQPMKATANMRMGIWQGGPQNFSDADVLLAIGYNPMVSSFAPFGGLQGTDPFATLRKRKAEGLKLVVIDPRRTELAAQADIHLQVKPGEDPALLAGMLNVILSEDLHDQDFCEQWVEPGHLDMLRLAVEAFTPEYVAERCGVEADDMVAGARMFAAGPTGISGSGTGPSMSPHPSLMEHLSISLNVVCGRFMREGQQIESAAFLQPDAAKHAHVIGPFGDPSGPESRFRGLKGYNNEMPCATLAQEIYTPGPEQVRALIVNGGNPVAAWPDQIKSLKAMEEIELLIVIDHRMTQTAEFADYIFAPRLSLERSDVPPFMDRWFREPYACYTEAVLEPEGDLLNDWEVYWEIAERMGIEITLPGGTLPTGERPTDDQVLDVVYSKSRVPMDVIRANAGKVLPDRKIMVQPADPDARGRFQIALADHMEELAAVRREGTSAEIVTGFDPAVHTFRLISRRLKTHLNSLGGEIPGLAKKTPTNYAYMNPMDMSELGVDDDGLVRITSPHAELIGVVMGDASVRRGVVSMSHSWGSATGTDEKVRDIGAPTNRLIDVENGYCHITGQAIQSAIPVSVIAVTDDALIGV